MTIDRDTWNSQKQATSIIESGEDVALEKLTTELEENRDKDVPAGWKEEKAGSW